MNCPTHAAQPIVGACTRCGNFVCALDSREVKARRYCFDCARRLVDHLATLRDEYWGRRDGWAWVVGLGSIYNGLAFLSLLLLARRGLPSPGLYPLLALVGVATVNNVAYFLGARFTRVGIIVLPLVGMLLIPLERSPNPEAAYLLCCVGVAVGLGIHRDARNKLFFKIDPGPAALEKLWQRYKNNQFAQSGFFCSFLGLVVPGLSVLALVFALVGLSRVNPDTTPPIGRRGQAIAGIVLSILGIVEWAVIIRVIPHR